MTLEEELKKKVYDELLVWQLKDILSARQTAMNVAGDFYAGIAQRENVSDERIFQLAEKIFEWLYQDTKGTALDKITQMKLKGKELPF